MDGKVTKEATVVSFEVQNASLIHSPSTAAAMVRKRLKISSVLI